MATYVSFEKTEKRMRLLKSENEVLTCEISHEEIRIIKVCLGEICYGIDIHAFETRIGSSRERVGELVTQLKTIIDEQGIEE
jgi:hypothetical protein